jgi:rhomboid protease GluP
LTRLAADADPQEALEAAAQRQQFFARLHGRMPRLRVTPAIVGANVVVFVLMLFAGAGMLQPDANVHLAWGANYGPATKEGGWWRLLASTFLHYGVVHVAFNMWALTDAGRLVERLYGSIAFLALYLFSGLTGSFASLLWSADRVVSVGASGAVFGVYGALIACLVAQRGSVPAIVLKGLATSASIFVGYVLVFGALQKGIDNAAHVGGLLGGIAAGFALSGPLEPGTRSSAPRHLLAALGAAAVLGVLWSLVPPARFSYAAQLAAERAINATSAEEAVVMGRARATLDARGRGELSETQTASRLEREVVAALDAAYRRLAAIELAEQAPAKSQLALLTRYIATKRELFAAYAQGLRSGDEAKLRRADDLADESQRLLEEIKRLPRRPAE